MNKLFFIIAFVITLLTACGNQKAAPKEAADGPYFPVATYLKGQVAQVDSSLHTLIQINKNKGKNDTVYIHRETFKTLSGPFTSLPDITTSKVKNKYTESRLYDEMLDRFIITYTPKTPADDLEIMRQDVVITPNTGDGDKVESAYIERQLNQGDSTVQLKMSWEVATGFTIRTIIQKKGEAEKLQTTQVAWLDPRSAAKL